MNWRSFFINHSVLQFRTRTLLFAVFVAASALAFSKVASPELMLLSVSSLPSLFLVAIFACRRGRIVVFFLGLTGVVIAAWMTPKISGGWERGVLSTNGMSVLVSTFASAVVILGFSTLCVPSRSDVNKHHDLLDRLRK